MAFSFGASGAAAGNVELGPELPDVFTDVSYARIQLPVRWLFANAYRRRSVSKASTATATSGFFLLPGLATLFLPRRAPS